MLTRLRKMTLSPRLWLSAGLFCFGVSVVLGYHQDQMAANRVLAEKVGLPPEVLIQDFVSEQDTNVVGELYVLAEVNLSATTRMNAGTESRPEWVDLVPVFSVGSDARPFAAQYLADKASAPRRPMPRARAQALAEERARIAMLERQPIGVIVLDDETDHQMTPANLGLTVLGEGENGPLVKIMGVRLFGTTLYANVSEAMTAARMRTMPEVLMISPYSSGRESAFAATDFEHARRAMMWIGILVSALALARMFSLLPALPRRRQSMAVGEKAVAAFPAFNIFQPIRTQEELATEEAESKGGRGTRIISRLIA